MTTDAQRVFNAAASHDEVTIACESGAVKVVMGSVFITGQKLQMPVVDPEALIDIEAEKEKFQKAKGIIEDAYIKREARAKHLDFELQDPVEQIVFAERGIATSGSLGRYILKKISANTPALNAIVESLNIFRDNMIANNRSEVEAREGISAEKKATLIKQKEAMIREEFHNVRDDYILTLTSGAPHAVSDIPPESILVTPNMNVGNLITYRSETGAWFMEGMANAHGSQTGHTAVVSRAAGLQRVRIDEEIMDQLKPGDYVILDGTRNQMIINPKPDTLARYKAFAEKQRQIYFHLLNRLDKVKDQPLRTRDGKTIHIKTNIATSSEIRPALKRGAEGIGLYRTEMPALISGGGISEERWEVIFGHFLKEEKEGYVAANPGKSLQGREAPIIRTLDLSGDKQGEDKNPEPKQIRALIKSLKKDPDYKAALLIPQVHEPNEFNALGQLMREEAAKAGINPLLFGAMLENSDIISDMDKLEADFFSVGTNDLCALVSGVDRYNEKQEKYKDYTHPEFLGLLAEAQRKADNMGKPICICGDMASDLLYQPLLIGMGYEHLSVGPDAIPGSYEYISRLDSNECKFLAYAVTQSRSREERENLLRQFALSHGMNEDFTINLDWKPSGNPPPSIALHMQ